MLIFDQVSKRYRLGQVGATTLREELSRGWRHIRRRPPTENQSAMGKRLEGTEFWALRSISLEIQPGEIVGVIGANGAGKSTLLKLAARITAPTAGEIRLTGRVGSLLEVGTGFHPELTGRENIFLNGAIMGMNRAEVAAKLDAIVSFANVEDFLETPVKRYSSGMYMRLAFAVAAHLDPEILLVDEVLAVGDVRFQDRCLGKLKDITESGRTVLFVSHNMTLINRYCERVIVIEDGALALDTRNAMEAVERYQGSVVSRFEPLSFPEIDITDFFAEPAKSPCLSSDPIKVSIRYRVKKTISGLVVGVTVTSREVGRLAFSAASDQLPRLPTVEPGNYCAILTIPSNTLTTGFYDLFLQVTHHNHQSFTVMRHALQLEVVNLNGVGRNYIPGATYNGLMRPDWNWNVTQTVPEK